MKNLLSDQSTLPRKPDGPSRIYKTVMIAHHWPFIMKKRSELPKKECFIGDFPRPSSFLPAPPFKKRVPYDESDMTQTGVKTARHKKW